MGGNMRRLTVLAAIAGFVLAFVAPQASAAGPKPKKDKDTYVQLLAINDFHGHLLPGTPGTIRDPDTPAGTAVPAGGAAYLATTVKSLRGTNANTITVGAGDLIGASPLVSALFHDEPSIEALGMIGLDVTAVGNHEFDEGVGELLRMQFGGCHPVDGCQDGTPFPGALFQYLAANVFFQGTGNTILPAYEIRKIDNAKIGFVGLTLEGTPTIVTPSGVAGLEFRDEIETVNALVRKLRDEQGVRSFVVLLHEGGQQNAPFSRGFANINGCENLSGAIVNIVGGLDPLVDVVVSAHTHQPYVCTINQRLVTSASSFGRLVTDIDLVIDHQTKDIKHATAVNRIVRQDNPATPEVEAVEDPDVKAFVNQYVTLSAPLANRVLGSITADIRSGRDNPSGTNAAGEQPMGDVIADAMLEAAAHTDFGGAVAAFMNSGGVRAGLLFNQISGGEAAGQVTYGEAFNVQPFGNTLVVKTCSGQAIYNVLEQQFNNPLPGQNRIMLVSANVHYQWNSTTTPRIVDGSVTFSGTPIGKATLYRVVMNSFMADGGDNYTVFRDQCTDPLGGSIDLDAFAAYLSAHSPLAPPALTRIERVG